MNSSQLPNIGDDKPTVIQNSKRGIVRNTVINLVNRLILLPVGIIAIPIILHGMGTDRFGLFSITWTLLNYIAILDFGLSQAITKYIAAELNKGETRSIPNIFWTSTVLMLILGIIICLVVLFLSPWVVTKILHPPQDLISESIRMFQWLALSVPFIFMNNSLRGTLEAALRFDLVNVVRTPYSALIYLSPLLGYIIGFRIDHLTALLLGVVILANLVYLLMCTRIYPYLISEFRFKTSLLRGLLSYSGWTAISSFISPILVYLDRFLISGVLTVSVLAFYTAPYEALTRLWLIPMSLTATLFPVFSRDTVDDDQIKATNRTLTSAFKYVLLTLGPITAFIFVFPREILNIWIGSEFAEKSYIVTQILVLGILINSLGRLPATMFLGRGYPDIPAKLHLIELPLYIAVAWICLKAWGINGAAFAWTLRVGVDTILLYYIARRHNAIRMYGFNKRLAIGITSLVGLMVLGILPGRIDKNISSMYLVSFFVVLLLIFVFIAWKKILDQDERSYLINLLRKFTPLKFLFAAKRLDN